MLTVLTWLWSQPGGRTKYTAGHVNIWAAMVRRHLGMPHRIACVTDAPLGLDPGIEIIAPPGDFVGMETPTWQGGLPNCFRRIAMFRPDAGEIFGDRFVCMDTDCVISDALDPLFDRNDDFVMYSGTNFDRPYNGSMMMMDAGARPQVFEGFSQAGAVESGARFIGSDQAWISHVLGWGEATWGPKDGVAWWGSQWNEDRRLMFFPGNPKPWDLVGKSRYVSENYRGDAGGTCLALSVGPSLWADVARAGKHDAVISLPEPSRYWPGPLREIVEDERMIEAAARMHGFDSTIWCGRMAGT